jgi:sugar lactone lactonase YvrE
MIRELRQTASPRALEEHDRKQNPFRFEYSQLPVTTHTTIIEGLPRSLLGESPVFDAAGVLTFIDINGKAIHRTAILADDQDKGVATSTPIGTSVTTFIFDQLVGFTIPIASSSPLTASTALCIGLEDKVIRFDLATGETTVLAKVPRRFYRPGRRFNDARCDPDGVVYAGYMDLNWRQGIRGHLFKLEPRKGIAVVNADADADAHDGDEDQYPYILRSVLEDGENGLHLPNGQAWLSLGEVAEPRLYIVDSGLNAVVSFERRQRSVQDADDTKANEISATVAAVTGALAESGSDAARSVSGRQEDDSTAAELTNKQVIFRYAATDGGMLDGMIADSRNRLWIAVTNASAVICVDPVTGLEIARVCGLPATKPTALTIWRGFLYITSRNDNGADTEPMGPILQCRILDETHADIGPHPLVTRLVDLN